MKKINWKPVLLAILSALMGLLGGAGYEKFKAPADPPAAYESTDATIASHDATKAAIFELELYWSLSTAGIPGEDLFYHRLQATIKGIPNLESVKAAGIKPPFEGAELKKLQSARFIRNVLQPAPNPPGPIEEKPTEDE